LVLHAAINARALHGEAAFASTVHAIQRIPALPLLEAAVVYVPLAVHGVIGGWLVATGRELAGPKAPYSRAMRAAVRVTGVGVAAFLAMHLPELRFDSPGVHLEGGALATRLDADLSSVSHGVPWRGVVYLVGSGCAIFHLAAGLWGAFAARERARDSKRSRRWAAWTLAALGAAMWLALANVIVFRATGGQLFGERVEETPNAPCP
jgi:succinate dehydrogenase/fumarate reductase cytochrome b subunit